MKNSRVYVGALSLLLMFFICANSIIYAMDLAYKMKQREAVNKQTIEELRSDIDNWSLGYSDLENRVVELQEENEKLKAEVDKYATENQKLHQQIKDTEAEQEPEKTLVLSAKKAEIKQEEKKQEVTGNKFNLSESDIYLLAQLIYLEGGATSYKCQLAIGSVALNLMKADGVSLKSEINTPGRFSVASSIPYTTPSDTSLKAARQLATSGTTLPSSVNCFRNNYYFSWCKPYCCIDNVYFGSY